jgi:acyl-CoA thioester hydrolase
VLMVEVGTADFQLARCDFVFRLTNTTSQKEVSRVKTGIAFFNKQTRKISAVPDAFRKKCESANSASSQHTSA